MGQVMCYYVSEQKLQDIIIILYFKAIINCFTITVII